MISLWNNCPSVDILKVRKFQSKNLNCLINRNKLGCFINEIFFNPKYGPAYCQVVSAILLCEKKPFLYHYLKEREGARAN